MPGDFLQHDGGVLHRARQHAGLIERGCVGDDAPARAAAISRLEADDAAKACRLADRAAGIGSERRRRRMRRHRRRGSAGRPARNQIAVVADRFHRTLRWPKCARQVGGTHREFVLVGLAEQCRAGRPDLARHRGVVGRNKILQNPACRGRAHPFGAEHVLHGDRNTFQRPSRAALQVGVGARRIRERPLGCFRDERVEVARARKLIDRGLRQFARRKALCTQSVAQFRNAEIAK